MPPFTANHSSKYDSDAVVSEASRDTPGLLPDDIYNATLPRWRAAIRAHLVKAVARESIVIGRLQVGRSRWVLIGLADLVLLCTRRRVFVVLGWTAIFSTPLPLGHTHFS